MRDMWRIGRRTKKLLYDICTQCVAVEKKSGSIVIVLTFWG